MLDFNEELAKFQPCADLEEAEENIYGKELEEIKKNKTELYKANQMIKKYNQALNYAKQGNDDLAMLQLKNVVASIPNFVDAYLLMALLSIKGENYDNARTFLDTILKIDPNNESAVEYGKEFETKVVEEEPQTTEPEKKDKKKKEKKKVVSQPEEPKKKKLFEKKNKKDKKDEQIADLTDKLTRHMAEFDNYRKRTEKEKSAMYEIGAKDVVEKILPIVDNFERGLQSVPEEKKDDPFVDGMDKIYKQMMSTLEGIGVKPIEAVGQEFDPNFHNAVMHVEDEELGENVVAEEFQKGYMYRDSVVRHSMVKVAN